MNLPEWMISIERLIEGSKTGRARLATMQKGMATKADVREAPLKKRRAKKRRA
jgi:hypothetical protein